MRPGPHFAEEKAEKSHPWLCSAAFGDGVPESLRFQSHEATENGGSRRRAQDTSGTGAGDEFHGRGAAPIWEFESPWKNTFSVLDLQMPPDQSRHLNWRAVGAIRSSPLKCANQLPFTQIAPRASVDPAKPQPACFVTSSPAATKPPSTEVLASTTPFWSRSLILTFKARS